MRFVIGGYDPNLAPEGLHQSSVQGGLYRAGRGGTDIRELLRALERGGGFEGIAGFSYRAGDGVLRNPDRSVHRLADWEIRLRTGKSPLHSLDASLT